MVSALRRLKKGKKIRKKKNKDITNLHAIIIGLCDIR